MRKDKKKPLGDCLAAIREVLRQTTLSPRKAETVNEWKVAQI